MPITSEEWVDVVIQLRTAELCGTISRYCHARHDDAIRNRIYEQVKRDTLNEFAPFIKAHGCQGEPNG